MKTLTAAPSACIGSACPWKSRSSHLVGTRPGFCLACWQLRRSAAKVRISAKALYENRTRLLFLCGARDNQGRAPASHATQAAALASQLLGASVAALLLLQENPATAAENAFPR
jgi:hypothetical protein